MSIVSGLNGVLRELYRRYLKRFAFAKIIRNTYLLLYFKAERYHVRFTAKVAKPHLFELMPLQEYASLKKSTKKTLIEQEFFDSTRPIARGYNAEHLNTNQISTLSIPSISVHEVKNAVVMSRTEGFVQGGSFVYPQLVNIKRDVIPIEEIGLAKIASDGAGIEIRKHGSRGSIDRAISLIGQCSVNYAHWLTETLPKLALISEIEKYQDFPILIDDSVHPNILESAKIIAGENRNVYTLPHLHWVKVRRLVYVDPTAYVPVRTRDHNDPEVMPTPRPDLFAFSRQSLSVAKNAIYRALQLDEGTGSPRKRVFLIRTPENCSNGRLLLNQESLIKIAEKYGFEIVDPQNLNFSDQVRLMRDTKVLVGAVGAALCNCIFMPEAGIVLGLAPYYYNANGYYFSNFVSASGQKFAFILGKQEENSGFIVHRNYCVSGKDFEDSLLEYLPEAIDTLAVN